MKTTRPLLLYKEQHPYGHPLEKANMDPLFRRHTRLTTAIDALSELIEQREADVSLWQRSVQAVLQEGEHAPLGEMNQAQQHLAAMMQNVPLIVASFLAMCSGALIERGADATFPAPVLLQRTQNALLLATRFAQECLEEARRHHMEDEQKEGQKSGHAQLDPEACVQQYGASLAETQMEAFLGWQALDFLTRATLALVLHSPQQRAVVRGNLAFMQALAECPVASTSHDMLVALHLLENEQLIVLHPALRRGYRIRINNLGRNFELHLLLADALIGDPAQGWLSGQKPDPRVVAAAKDGFFPLPCDEDADAFPEAEGAFNLWNWRGLQPDGRLPTHLREKTHWIWNEGQPVDIEPFEGTRVILLGPLPYHRSWNAGRFFPQLHGELEVLEKLSEEQVNVWLSTIAAAVEAGEDDAESTC